MEPLDYARPRPLHKRRWVIRATLLVTLAIAMYVGGLYVPLHHVSSASMCRACGHAEVTSTWRIAGYQVWQNTKTLKSTYWHSEEIYDRLIAQPHAHRLFRYAVTSEHGNLWYNGSIGEGGPNEPAMATRAGLSRMELEFADLPVEHRRAIYAELQKCRTKEEVEALDLRRFRHWGQ